MNTQYFIYAIEVEKTGSITQAASNLFMSQPTLSKAIKDMEESVGFSVFKRSAKGMIPTQRGLEFLAHAKRIAAQVQKMEQALQANEVSHQLFSLAIPRVSYIANAVSEYVRTFDTKVDMEIDILEDYSVRIIDSVADGQYVLGIIRCHAEDEDYFIKKLAEKELQHETIWQSDYRVLMHADHPLSEQEILEPADFLPYIEVAFGDDEVPYVRVSESQTACGMLKNSKRILVHGRAMQFDLLRTNSLTYMWVSPMPADVLRANNLIQRKCRQSGQFKDILISRSGYRFSKLDRRFLDTLFLQRNSVAYVE